MKRKLLTVFAAASMTLTSLSGVYAADTTEMPAIENGETPPDKPEGETGEMPPEMPEGETGEMPPEMPDGEMGKMPPDMNGMPGAGSTALSFTDVEENMWYYSCISQAYSLGFISGVSDELFMPESTVTGAQLLSMLYRADGNSGTSTDGSWYDTAVEWAEENSILTSDNGWEFDANAALTRQQTFVILYRYMVYKGMELSEAEDLSSFTDSSDVSAYAQEAIGSLTASGIVSGDGTELRPNDTLTRAEAAALLVNALPASSEAPSQGGNMPEGGAPDGNMPEGGAPGGFGGSGEITQGTAADTISEDGTYSGTEYSSTDDDENALRIEGAAVTLDGITVNKSAGASSNTEDGDFYGMNAAVLATDGAQVTITNSTVNSSAQNGNGVFSYGENTVVNISDTVINTTADNSGGIQTTGGGTTNAQNLTVTTAGSSAAAIRSDRGGGTVTVDGGTYTSNGYNSPAVYSTADITVSNAELTANNSEALVIEGQNSITLYNCDVTGNMSDTKGTSSDENVHNVMIYQSMSGDAEVGTSEFSMTGGSLTSQNGDMFYITNTHSVIELSDVDITNEDEDSCLMRVSGNSASRGWGTAGANGAQTELTLNSQVLDGDIVVDTISTLEMLISNGSEFTGTINIIDNEQNGTAVSDNAVITVDKNSVWTLTGNCVITSLENNGTINFNGYTITLADGTVLSE